MGKQMYMYYCVHVPPFPLPPYTHAYTHRRTYAHTHTHTHTCTHMHAHTHARTHACMHARTRTHTRIYYLSVFSTDFPLVTCYPSSSASYWCWLDASCTCQSANMALDQQQTINTLLTWLQILPHIYSMFIRSQPAAQQWVQLVTSLHIFYMKQKMTNHNVNWYRSTNSVGAVTSEHLVQTITVL